MKYIIWNIFFRIYSNKIRKNMDESTALFTTSTFFTAMIFSILFFLSLVFMMFFNIKFSFGKYPIILAIVTNLFLTLPIYFNFKKRCKIIIENFKNETEAEAKKGRIIEQIISWSIISLFPLALFLAWAKNNGYF